MSNTSMFSKHSSAVRLSAITITHSLDCVRVFMQHLYQYGLTRLYSRPFLAVIENSAVFRPSFVERRVPVADQHPTHRSVLYSLAPFRL